eukprot:gb/GEZN01015177.1/.p1 GENE.gb/GEZN01015177.1/~~gb/GEZN01015177.1/.p1  ORF type:complete len:115 (-),score=6.00 gb/GEZN01015177.1/:495-839(-)
MVCDLLCCGQCCGILSVIGSLFLLAVGGIIASGSPAIQVNGVNADSPEDAAKVCYKAAAIYGGFVALSLMCFAKGKFNQKNRVEIDDPRSARDKLHPIITVIHTIKQDRKTQVN